MTMRQRRLVLLAVAATIAGLLIGWGIERVQYASAHPGPVSVTQMQASIGDHCDMSHLVLEAQPVASHSWEGKTTYVFQADDRSGAPSTHFYVTTQDHHVASVNCGTTP